MKKTKLTRSLLAACSIVALSAVMYGCAHTDSGPSQDELDAANAATDAAAAEAKVSADAAAAAVQAKADADAAAAADATAAADAAAVAKAAADDAAAVAKAAADDAAAVAKAAADDAAAVAKAAADDAAAVAKAAADDAAATAEADRLAAQDEADRLQGEADTAADTAAVAKAEGLFAAIKASVTAPTTNILAFAEEDGVPGITLNSPLASDPMMADPDGVIKLADMVLTTSRGADTMVPFHDHFMTTNGLLTITDGDHGADAKSERFPQTGTVEYGTDTDNAEEIILVGTLMGAAGKFHCVEDAAGDCHISKTAIGYSFAADEWYFTADAGENVTLPDDDYTGYGWWAYKTATGFVADAFTIASAEASRLTSEGDGTADFEALEGKATFEGGAAGKFAIDNRPLGTHLEAGHFTAVATLVADFDADMISGTVDEFVANDVARDGWEVALGDAPVALTAADGGPHFSLGATDLNANLWTIDDVDGIASGSWSGNFFNDGDARNDGTPEVVTGTFSVSHGSAGEVAHMIGAFQANNSHADTPSTDN